MIKEKKEYFGCSHNIFLQMTRDFVEICPRCKSIHISIRQRKKPKYRCQDCKNEFDNLKTKIVPKTQKQINEFGKQYSVPDE